MAFEKLIADADGHHDDGGLATKLHAQPGSPEAIKAWAQIDADAHSPTAIAKAKACHVPGAEKSVGFYNGKPLIPGVGPGQGDFDFLVDKLVATKGMTVGAAEKLAAHIKTLKYGAGS